MHVFDMQDPRIIEASGISSASEDGVLFTHNDSGDSARFFAIGQQGQTLATFSVLTGLAADWEDMARAPGQDGSPALYFGDIGDNYLFRPFITVYEIAEPPVEPSTRRGTVTVDITATKTLVYEDGPHDAESMFVDPKTKDIGIVTKSSTGVSGVYIAPFVNGSTSSTLRKVAEIDLNSLAHPAKNSSGRLLATSADISPDGKHFVVRSYTEAHEWSIDGGLVPALRRKPLSIPLPHTGEAIGYSNDGESLFTVSEGRPAPAHRLTLDTSQDACD